MWHSSSEDLYSGGVTLLWMQVMLVGRQQVLWHDRGSMKTHLDPIFITLWEDCGAKGCATSTRLVNSGIVIVSVMSFWWPWLSSAGTYHTLAVARKFPSHMTCSVWKMYWVNSIDAWLGVSFSQETAKIKGVLFGFFFFFGNVGNVWHAGSPLHSAIWSESIWIILLSYKLAGCSARHHIEHWTSCQSKQMGLSKLVGCCGSVVASRTFLVVCTTYKQQIVGLIPSWAELCSDIVLLGKALCRHVHSLDPGMSRYLVGQWRLVCWNGFVRWKWQPGCMLPGELRWLMNEQVLWPVHSLVWSRVSGALR